MQSELKSIHNLQGTKKTFGQLKAMYCLLLTAGLAIPQACSVKTEPLPSAKATIPFCLDPELKDRIMIQSVELAPVTQSRRLSGKVEFNPDKLVSYVSLVGGVVTNTYFTLGERVKKGQVLAEIRSTELSALMSERQVLESQLAVADRNVQSAQSMYNDGIASERDLLQAQSERSSMQAELTKIRSNLELYSASSERGVFLLKAPVSGFVVSKNISAGMQLVAESDPLFTISDLDEVWVTANVYAGDLDFVKEGLPVAIQTTAYRDQTFSGKIHGISQVFDENERVLKARISMKNTDLKLKPGMFVNVVVQKESQEQAVSVPEKALIFNHQKHFVVAYQDDCQIEVKEVTVLARNNGNVFLAEGIEPGKNIIARNHLLIYEALENSQK